MGDEKILKIFYHRGEGAVKMQGSPLTTIECTRSRAYTLKVSTPLASPGGKLSQQNSGTSEPMFLL